MAKLKAAGLSDVFSFENESLQQNRQFEESQAAQSGSVQNGVTYKVYYLVLRQGVGQSPTNTDAVLASYNGRYLQSTTVEAVTTVAATAFEEVKLPQQFLSLLGTVKGWSEIFPQFKTGSYEEHKVNNIPDGTIDYTDFGAGVMFIPSGLAYYNYGAGSIPSYAPLVFSFKLYEIQRLDSDGDGVLNYQEDLDGDGYMYDYRSLVNYPITPTTNSDDTDGDGIPNFFDIDDDGDNYTTKVEIKNTTTGLPYPFADIPTCTSGKKNFLDATCHP